MYLYYIMPAFIVHGLLGYLTYGKMGFYLGILPDLIGFSYYFLRIAFDYLSGNTDPLTKLMNQNSPREGMEYMNDTDWFLYHISHSLFFWGLIYLLFKKKYIFAAVFSIITDILLHSSTDGWSGPTFLYPFSNYTFDGVSWNSKEGMFITVAIVLFYLSKK
jgi:hypothetical protein